jgi:hypothetical protein
MAKASGKPSDDKLNSRTLNNSLQISVLQNSLELGAPIYLTITLKRKTATPQNVNISCSLNLQTYTGNKKTNLGVIQKTVQIHGQGTRSRSNEAPSRRETRMPTIGCLFLLCESLTYFNSLCENTHSIY